MIRLTRPKFLGSILAVTVVCIAVWAVVSILNPGHKTATSPSVSVLPKAEEGKSTQPSGETTSSPTPIPISGDSQTSVNGLVTITSPTQGSTVTSGTIVTGTATSSGNTLSYRLKGANSGQLALGPISTSSSNSAAKPFSFKLAFTNQVATGGDQGVLEVFSTGTDGTEQSIANVKVNIQG